MDRTRTLAADEKDGKPSVRLATFRKAVKHLHGAGTFTAEMLRDRPIRALIDETSECIMQGVDLGLQDNVVPKEMAESLARDVFVFSGCKTYHQLREASQLLLDERGRVKPFQSYYRQIEELHPTYNRHYLEAEYIFAVGSAQSAAQWAEIERDGNDYDLQYRTAADGNVRPAHARLEGLTRPVSDPCWNEIMPPNGWRCRCRVVQVRRGKYPQTDPAEARRMGREATTDIDAKGRNRAEMFRFNPGKEKVVFPKHHPYYNLSVRTKGIIVDMADEGEAKEDVQRIRTMIDEMPKNLSVDEKLAIAKNNIAIEKALRTTKGKPMTVEEADKQHANPNYGKDRAYSINCQTCAPAYMLRLKGFDVKAKPCTPGSKLDYLSRGRAWEVWKNTDGTPASHVPMIDWMKGKKYERMTPKRYREFFEEVCNEEGTYELSIGWRRGGGHATILQRFADGELRYIEPQTDNSPGSGREVLNIDYLCRAGATTRLHECRGIMRIDNKLFNLDHLDIFTE